MLRFNRYSDNYTHNRVVHRFLWQRSWQCRHGFWISMVFDKLISYQSSNCALKCHHQNPITAFWRYVLFYDSYHTDFYSGKSVKLIYSWCVILENVGKMTDFVWNVPWSLRRDSKICANIVSCEWKLTTLMPTYSELRAIKLRYSVFFLFCSL